MTAPTQKAVDGCDSECYLRHHLCAVREVRRLRALVDSFVGAPPDKDRYELLWDLHVEDGVLIEELRRAVDELRALAAKSEPMVPAAWLARANQRIGELTEAAIAAAAKKGPKP
ncbi:MAG: hypothetical protein IT459_22670 [Planctomycetes bacterium]|nr:hypothetical protein [Planctomycetota bacterium]